MGKPILKTELCDILGIEYPVISAGMGPTLLGETWRRPKDTHYSPDFPSMPYRR